jgi:Mg-chelatase subunit ChlD
MSRALPAALGLVLLLSVATLYADTPGGDEYRIELLGAVDASQFPEVAVKFRILDKKGEPAKELPQADIVIYEDGQEVHRIKPKLLREVPSTAMLVLDTSGSMDRQNKLAEAQRAAGVFAERLDPRTACGLVLFHHQPYFDLAPSSDRSKMLEAVRDAQSAGGTACFDAVKTALEKLGDVPKAQRQALVVMTDGRDVNSKAKLDEVIELARQSETPVHTIGLGEAGKRQKVRTVLVLDKSGSMNERNKIRSLRQGAVRYVELLPDHDADMTVITFNQRVSPAEDFSSNKERLKQQVQSIQAVGDTALFQGIWEGIETLNAGRSSSSAGTRQALIVFSDGLDNRGGHSPEEIAEHANKDGVRIYMLGLGNRREIDVDMMRSLAEATGGKFYHVENQDKLTEVFEELSIELHDDGIDEQALQRLAASTGGEYFHVKELDKLQLAFARLAATVDNTHSVRFTSKRARHDGTARGIEIHLGSLTTLQSGYATHGLLTPQNSTPLYLVGLVILAALLVAPALLRASR